MLLRLLVAAGLVTDAVVHLRLAGGYQLAQPGGIGEGTLFRIQAVVALLVALWVIVRGDRWAFAVAASVGFSALAAVVVYRYVDVPSLGPLPRMYEPVWFFQKVLSAIAEGLAGAFATYALVRVTGAARLHRRRGTPAPADRRSP